jgi:hypothetical protein
VQNACLMRRSEADCAGRHVVCTVRRGSVFVK